MERNESRTNSIASRRSSTCTKQTEVIANFVPKHRFNVSFCFAIMFTNPRNNQLSFISSTLTQTLTHASSTYHPWWKSLPLPRTLHSRVSIEVFVPPSHIPSSNPEKFVLCFDQQVAAFLSIFPLNVNLFIVINSSLLSSQYWHINSSTHTSVKSILIFIIVLFIVYISFVRKNTS